jgi:hypothetical protein
VRKMAQTTRRVAFVVFTHVSTASPALAQSYTSAFVTDSTISQVIPPEGGVLELPQFGRIIFPAGSFDAPETVELSVTNTPSTSRWLRNYGWVTEGRTPYLGFDLRIRAEHQPATSYVVEIILPRSYLDLVDDSWPPKVYREFIGGGRMEALSMYEELPSELDLEAGVIRAQVVTADVEAGTKLYDVMVVGCCEPNL